MFLPSNAIANALRAGFHLIAQRALPRAVGSNDLVRRWRHFKAAVSLGKCPLVPVPGLDFFQTRRVLLSRAASSTTSMSSDSSVVPTLTHFVVCERHCIHSTIMALEPNVSWVRALL